MDDSLWYLVSFVRRSKNRRQVLETLHRSPTPLTPTDIADKIKIGLPNTGRAVKSLREKGLIECLNPEDRTYRHYTDTEKGEKVIKQILQIEDLD